MKKHFRIISLALIISLIFTMLPFNTCAEETETASTTDQLEYTPQPQEKKESKIIGEVIEKREKNVKHFRHEDGTFEAVVYPTAIHYFNNVQWNDIDNTLVESKDEDGNDMLENKGNDFKVKVAKKASSKKLIDFKLDKYEISWGIDGMNDSKASIEPQNTKILDSLSQNDKAKAVRLPRFARHIKLVNTRYFANSL